MRVSFFPLETSSDASDVVIKSKVISPGDESIEMDFRVEKTADGWMIYDIEMGVIDLIRTYRSNFKSALQQGGIANLISALHRKNQEVRSARKE